MADPFPPASPRPCPRLTKMVYSSSLMEANFFTIAQRREYMLKAVEEANRLQTIQQLSNVGGSARKCGGEVGKANRLQGPSSN